MATWIAAGIALVGVGVASQRYGKGLKKSWPAMESQLKQLMGEARYKGGFQNDIDKYEAGKILGKFIVLVTQQIDTILLGIG